ncbi:hypothetical protein G6F55_014231 [Rhizopus delemar]|nr:hypothetical protein G6F55_014231 [Rhizopus delemar]
MVQAAHKGEGPRARQAAQGGFQAEDAAKRSRHADRPVGVRSQRQRHQTARHGGRAAAGRAARDAGGVVRVAACAVTGALGGETVGVFIHVQRADQHRASLAHAGH